MNNTELQKIAATRVNEIVKILNDKESLDKYKIQTKDLSVMFKIKGQVGGWAQYVTKTGACTLNFNLYLMKDNLEEYTSQVIPHEVCHLFVSKKFPKAKNHGYEWKYYMYSLNLTPSLYHAMNTSNVPTQINKVKYEYKCTGCGMEFHLSKTIHNKILQGQKRICGKCKHSIIFICNENL
jgi:predicted SprT family Zn-dependent metalloprotease